MARDRGRSLRGQRCYDSKPKNWGDNITIIGALTLAGLEAVMTLNGALTKEWFKEWVKRFLLPIVRFGDIVILDNLSAHKSQEIIAMVEAKGAKMIFLPPYSPDFNPIEKAWSKLKELMRGLKPRTRGELERALVWAQDQISGQDALGSVDIG